MFLRIHPLTRDASSLRGDVYSRHRLLISSGPSSSSGVKENCPFFNSSNRRRSTVWTISGLQEVAHNLAASFPATPRLCEDQQQEVLKSSSAASFPATSESLDKYLHKSATTP